LLLPIKALACGDEGLVASVIIEAEMNVADLEVRKYTHLGGR
jgi:hypothetical protein